MRAYVIALTVAAMAGMGGAPALANKLDDVVACRAVAGTTERLACYDAAVANLAIARDRKDVVIVDRDQIRETKRRLFGFTLPQLPVIGDPDGDQLTELDGTLASARSEGDGTTTFILADGSRWHQEDDVVIGYRARANDKVVVRRGALGSFRLSVAGHPGVRVRRLN